MLPAVLLLSFALWQRGRVRPGPVLQGEPTAPEDSVQKGPVEGWEASLPTGQSGALSLRLEHLHPHDSRQAFDATALAARLGRSGDGEPWRLLISSPAQEVGEVLLEDLAQVRIRGLEPLVGANERPGPGGASDPLRTLFAFPDGDLLAGEAVDLVFWGSAPKDKVVVTLPGPGAPSDVELLPMERLGSRASQSIATFDAHRGAKGQGR